MEKEHRYRATDRMSDLITDNFSLLMVMSRFGLKLGFGDQTVKDVCEAQGVDMHTFLAVANFVNEGQLAYGDDEQVSLSSLMEYLKNAHTYFLDFNLPTIRRKLIEALNLASGDNVGMLILKFFDQYVEEVRNHMEYENNEVFVYVEGVLEGRLSASYDIVTYSSRHNEIDSKLNELKNIIIKYYPESGNNNLMNSVLYDIFNCEQDLISHGEVEDYMFVPAVAREERRLKNGR